MVGNQIYAHECMFFSLKTWSSGVVYETQMPFTLKEVLCYPTLLGQQISK